MWLKLYSVRSIRADAGLSVVHVNSAIALGVKSLWLLHPGGGDRNSDYRTPYRRSRKKPKLSSTLQINLISAARRLMEASLLEICMLDRSKLVLIAFALTKLEAMTNWQIQAAVFLLQHRLCVSYPYPIELDSLGPYSEDLQNDLHALVSQDELEMASIEFYRATNYSNARELSRKALSDLAPTQLAEVKKMMSWLSTQPYGSLVTNLYRDYPDFRSYKKTGNRT